MAEAAAGTQPVSKVVDMTRKPLLFLYGVALLGLAGCGTDDSQPTMQQRQDAALKDPFNYGPTSSTPGAPVHPGQAGQMPTDANGMPKRDDSLNGDWKDFWNP